MGLAATSLEFILEELASGCVTIHNYRDSAFLSASLADRFADAFRAARYQHNFVLDLKVHGERAVAVYDGLDFVCITSASAAKIQETSIDGIVGTGDK